MKTEQLELCELHLDDRNVVAHEDLDVEAIARSLEKFGQQKPIVVSPSGWVAAGNGTVMAARRLGWTHLAGVVSGLEPDELMAFSIADNHTARLSQWDEVNLLERLEEIQVDEELLAATSFSDGDLELLKQSLDTTPRTVSRTVSIESLTAHPRNYREHPQDQLEHIGQSLEAHGFYRHVIVAEDLTILAGHGLVQAATMIGLQHVPVIVLRISPDCPAALKVLAGDNEVSNLAGIDDRQLTEMLKELHEEDQLLGTGFDPMQLAMAAMITRSASEISNKNEAAEWVGMPDYDEGEDIPKAVISFRSTADRVRFAELLGLNLSKGKVVSSWWPPKEREDPSSIRFTEEDEDEPQDTAPIPSLHSEQG
jgi:ParB-like chromosome segregation protein Spo0J